MSRHISPSTKKIVARRAGFRCEYCRVHESDSFLPFEIDHIVSLKHGGGNEIENLAFVCPHCNQYKGTDLTTFLDSYQDVEVLFNPRIQNWFEHFSIIEGKIIPQSRIGRATVKVLKLNELERLIHRRILMEEGHYP